MYNYNNLKEIFNKKSNEILNQYIKSPIINEQVKYIFDGGKRLRPVIALDICLKSGGKIEDIIHSAIAIELIHNASLIIDDLPCMDNDDIRRGKPSFHIKYSLQSAQLIASYMIRLAFKLIIDNFKDKKLLLVMNNISKNIGILGIAGGQLLDLTYLTEGGSMCKKRKKINELFTKKTCSLFEISFIIGYLGSDRNDITIDKLIETAKYFGIAFQIYDDFYDIEQDNNRGDNDPNFINNFGKDSAYLEFKNSLDQFKKNMIDIQLDSLIVGQLYDLLLDKVNKKLYNI